ncbi:MAG TPA: biotin/lipoyl-containing protein [Thermoanaerobaculia bacterium]|nr:biotin/lipoyl-containing protein [Thermoanaerobaculia bacterium]
MKLIAKYRDELVPVDVERDEDGYRVNLRGRWIRVDLVAANRFFRSLRLEDGRQFLIVHDAREGRHQISFGDRTIDLEIHDPLALRARRSDDADSGSGRVAAPMPGRVVRILVAPGEEVRKGAGLLILEAMKMQNEILAPRNGIVREILIVSGQTVESDATLVWIEGAVT